MKVILEGNCDGLKSTWNPQLAEVRHRLGVSWGDFELTFNLYDKKDKKDRAQFEAMIKDETGRPDRGDRPDDIERYNAIGIKTVYDVLNHGLDYFALVFRIPLSKDADPIFNPKYKQVRKYISPNLTGLDCQNLLKWIRRQVNQYCPDEELKETYLSQVESNIDMLLEVLWNPHGYNIGECFCPDINEPIQVVFIRAWNGDTKIIYFETANYYFKLDLFQT